MRRSGESEGEGWHEVKGRSSKIEEESKSERKKHGKERKRGKENRKDDDGKERQR